LFVCDPSEPIENGADRPLDCIWIVPVHPVEETASDQPIDIGLRHLDRETPEAALPTLAEPRHPDCAGSPATPIRERRCRNFAGKNRSSHDLQLGIERKVNWLDARTNIPQSETKMPASKAVPVFLHALQIWAGASS
jgi:hypothetical protein